MPVFGPVRSRRLGLSLGVDLVPPKICSMDCVYCEVGRTTRLTTERAEYRPLAEIEAALRQALAEKACDVITLTGSGEPTLNLRFPEVVRLVRQLSVKPIAVLTNSTTLAVPEVFEALSEVDYVLASLDAVRPEAFRRVNRPAPGISPGDLVDGLARLRRKMRGELWLEILLVKGLNDAEEDIRALREAVAHIGPHRVQLNTVVRPPAESWATPLDHGEMLALARELEAEVIAPSPVRSQAPGKALSEEEVLAYLARRPAPAEELSLAFGVAPEEVIRSLERLVEEGRLQQTTFEGRTFYRLKEEREAGSHSRAIRT